MANWTSWALFLSSTVSLDLGRGKRDSVFKLIPGKSHDIGLSWSDQFCTLNLAVMSSAGAFETSGRMQRLTESPIFGHEASLPKRFREMVLATQTLPQKVLVLTEAVSLGLVKCTPFWIWPTTVDYPASKWWEATLKHILKPIKAVRRKQVSACNLACPWLFGSKQRTRSTFWGAFSQKGSLFVEANPQAAHGLDWGSRRSGWLHTSFLIHCTNNRRRWLGLRA